MATDERFGRRLGLTSWWAVVVSAAVYALLHLLLVLALLAFGQRAGSYPLQAVAIGAYGLQALAGCALALQFSVRARTGVGRLLPLLGLAIFLAVALAGAFLATETLGILGLRTAYAPYLDGHGFFAVVNVALVLWIVVLALAVRWRGLLVAGMAAQGLALLLNPGLLAMGAGFGLWSGGYPLFALPVLYLGAALLLGWRPRLRDAATLAAAMVGAMGLAALLAGILPHLQAVPVRQPGNPVTLAAYLVATGSGYVFILGLPVLAWGLRGWARGADAPTSLAATGAGLALLAGVAAVSWHTLGPVHGPGGGFLPAEGQSLGRIGKTVPLGAYSRPGDVLTALRQAYPWLLGTAALAWLVAAVRSGQRRRFLDAIRGRDLPGGLLLLAFGMLHQGPLLLAFPQQALIVQGLGGALARIAGGWGLVALSMGLFTLLGLALLGLGALLRDPATRGRGWLTFGAMLLSLAAALILSGGLVAGTMQNLDLQRSLTLPEFRQAAQLRLALSLPFNAAFACLGWAMFAAGVRALTTPGNAAWLPGRALRRGMALTVGLVVLLALAFWQLTALPVAETSPRDGAAGIPTNAPVMVRLRPAERNWGPGITATYADTGAYVPGTTGGGLAAETWFTPANGWRPNARVKVRVCCGPLTRGYEFSFSTAAGPSAAVAPPPGPGPMPTALPVPTAPPAR